MENQKTYYDILNCPTNATYDDLKKSYHNLILRSHPDKQNQCDAQSYEFIAITEAWDVLRCADKRRAYDAQLLQTEFNDMPIIFETLTRSDFITNPKDSIKYFQCRCGGFYYLPTEEPLSPVIDNGHLSNHYCFIECDECSLVVQLND